VGPRLSGGIVDRDKSEDVKMKISRERRGIEGISE
jgi:hypothetical protein